MAIHPRSKWRPIPENKTQSVITPTTIILHTAVDHVGRTSLFGFFNQARVKVESHFFVMTDGTVEQYMNTERRADANRRANSYAVSIETEDDGDPSRPWTELQINSIIELLVWLHEEHDIPLTKCTSPTSGGIGWHAMWGAPSVWTPSRGKTCPGPVRVGQIEDRILPALAGVTQSSTPEEDMPLTTHQVEALFVQRLEQIYLHTGPNYRDPEPSAVSDWLKLARKPGADLDELMGAAEWLLGTEAR